MMGWVTCQVPSVTCGGATCEVRGARCEGDVMREEDGGMMWQGDEVVRGVGDGYGATN